MKEIENYTKLGKWHLHHYNSNNLGICTCKFFFVIVVYKIYMYLLNFFDNNYYKSRSTNIKIFLIVSQVSNSVSFFSIKSKLHSWTSTNLNLGKSVNIQEGVVLMDLNSLILSIPYILT